MTDINFKSLNQGGDVLTSNPQKGGDVKKIHLTGLTTGIKRMEAMYGSRSRWECLCGNQVGIAIINSVVDCDWFNGALYHPEHKLKKGENMKSINNTKGFTLIELSICIVILGILTVVALPAFSNMKSGAEDATAQGILGALRTQFASDYALNPQLYTDGTDLTAAGTAEYQKLNLNGAVLGVGGVNSSISATLNSTGKEYVFVVTQADINTSPKVNCPAHSTW